MVKHVNELKAAIDRSQPPPPPQNEEIVTYLLTKSGRILPLISALPELLRAAAAASSPGWSPAGSLPLFSTTRTTQIFFASTYGWYIPKGSDWRRDTWNVGKPELFRVVQNWVKDIFIEYKKRFWSLQVASRVAYKNLTSLIIQIREHSFIT